MKVNTKNYKRLCTERYNSKNSGMELQSAKPLVRHQSNNLANSSINCIHEITKSSNVPQITFLP